MHEARHPLMFTMLDELVLRERMPRLDPPKEKKEPEDDDS